MFVPHFGTSFFRNNNDLAKWGRSLLRKSIYTRENRILAALLKASRLSAGMTQEQLAELLRVPKSRISGIEHGERRLDLPQLKTYVETMGVPITVFVERFAELCQEAQQ